jgi:erythronate-4-phosphate dehydrogenase
MIRIVADDKIPFLKGVLESYAEMVYLPGGSINKEQLQRADALIVRTRTHCDASLLEGTRVKAIATATIGTDHMDIPWLENNGIRWTNAPGCNSGSVKQYVASVLAHLIVTGIPLKDKTLGIVGVGNVGRKVKDVAMAFGMRVLLNDPPRQETEPNFEGTELSNLLQQADLVTFHVPLTYKGPHPTFHLFNKDTLTLLKKGSIIINSSRGEVVDQEALMEGLENRVVKKAVLDVWEHEPRISKTLQEKLMAGTPHIAGYSIDGKANGTAAAVQFISRCFNLPLETWVPGNLPDPDHRMIEVDTSTEEKNLILAKAILQTYNVMEDSNRLMANLGDFEKLRGQYPMRREFPYYTFPVKEGSPELQTALSLLGFSMIH